MRKVWVYAATGRFRSFKAMRRFIDGRYDADGNFIPSGFAQEIWLRNFEPGCVEAVHAPQVQPLRELLRGVSWADQWLYRVDSARTADAAICVYEPNEVALPLGRRRLNRLRIEFVGVFEYAP